MIVTAGELLAEFISHQTDCGLEKTGIFSGPYASGAPAIFIDQAARVGANTKMIGSVGNDPFGKLIIKRLANDGVCTADITVLDDKATGVAIVSYFFNGSRVFVFHLKGTASERVKLGDIPQGPFTLHVSGASLTLPQARESLLSLAEYAKAQRGKVSFDPNVRAEMMSDTATAHAVRTLFSISDYVLPSEADLLEMYPTESIDSACQRILADGAELVVLKRGSEGVKVFSADEVFELPGHRVEEVDPTGAGDCFCGAFLGLLDCGVGLHEALKLANAAGAIHVTERGPMEKNPNLAEIQTFLKGAH